MYSSLEGEEAVNLEMPMGTDKNKTKQNLQPILFSLAKEIRKGTAREERKSFDNYHYIIEKNLVPHQERMSGDLRIPPLMSVIRHSPTHCWDGIKKGRVEMGITYL